MKLQTSIGITVFLFFTIYANSQNIIKTGFIMFENGHALKGEVKARTWHITPQTIFFREQDQQEFVEYTTDNVKWYSADNDRYMRAEVWIDHRPVDYLFDPDTMLPEHTIRLEKDTVFLKCLVLGSKYDLLELADGQKAIII